MDSPHMFCEGCPLLPRGVTAELLGGRPKWNGPAGVVTLQGEIVGSTNPDLAVGAPVYVDVKAEDRTAQQVATAAANCTNPGGMFGDVCGAGEHG